MAGAALCAASNAAATEPGGPDEGVRTLLKSYPACIKIGGRKDLQIWQPAEQYISTLVDKAELAIGPEDNDTQICTDPDRSGEFGAYSAKTNILYLTWPSPANVTEIARTEEDIVLTLRHEWRHHMQNKAGFDVLLADQHMPRSDRLALQLAEEADARVEAAAFADKKRGEGHAEYVAGMLRDHGNKTPMKAYEQSVGYAPKDKAAAMRAAFTAFYNDRKLAGIYCSWASALVPDTGSVKAGYAAGASPALSDKTLHRLGERPGQAGYIDQSIMSLIRKGCTP